MAGIYVHIPFCKSRCRYCDFFSTTMLEKRSEYVDAVLAEWEEWQKESNQWLHPKTLYIGGGTPSVLETNDIGRLVRGIAQSPEDMEITIEANPGDLSLEKLSSLKQIGINRLSMGIQSFDDRLLQLIGRRHTEQEAYQAVRNAQEVGFENISIDLIYGIPTQTLEGWNEDVQKAMALEVPHISCYCLSYEEHTPLTQMLQKGEIEEIDEEIENAMYDDLHGILTANGYEHYEISNFAKKDYQSQHNSNYWNGTAYLGLGAGAHSFDGKKRWWNPLDLSGYLKGITMHSLHREIEELTPEQQRIETIMLGLRTDKGIEKQYVETQKAEKYVKQMLLKDTGERYVATLEGTHILNQIISNLI